VTGEFFKIYVSLLLSKLEPSLPGPCPGGPTCCITPPSVAESELPLLSSPPTTTPSRSAFCGAFHLSRRPAWRTPCVSVDGSFRITHCTTPPSIRKHTFPTALPLPQPLPFRRAPCGDILLSWRPAQSRPRVSAVWSTQNVPCSKHSAIDRRNILASCMSLPGPPSPRGMLCTVIFRPVSAQPSAVSPHCAFVPLC